MTLIVPGGAVACKSREEHLGRSFRAPFSSATLLGVTNPLRDAPAPLPQKTIEALAYLRGYLVPEVSGEDAIRTPKVAWKAKVLYQCLVRRVLDAADGTVLGWNADNLLTAITMARSLVETAAALFDLSENLSKAVSRGSLDEADAILMARMFAWKKAPGVAEDIPASTNVLTLIDRLDDWLRKRGASAAIIRAFYEDVSEFVHPNNLGIAQIYTDNDDAKRSVSFRPTEQTRTGLYDQIKSALGLLSVAKLAVVQFETLLPEVVRLNLVLMTPTAKSQG